MLLYKVYVLSFCNIFVKRRYYISSSERYNLKYVVIFIFIYEWQFV